MNKEEFADLWLNQLNEEQRTERINASLQLVRKVAEEQIVLLKEFEASSADKDETFLYYLTTFQEAWRNVDFALHLGGGEFQEYSFFPTRAVMESTFRLEYFSHSKKAVQLEIARKEIMRIAKRFYELEKKTTGEIKQYAEIYRNFAEGTKFEDIDKVKEKELDAFPSMRELTSQSKIDGGEAWYFHYQCLAENTHGKLMSIIMREDNAPSEHRRSLMYIQTMCNDLIKNADFQLGGKTKERVVNAIQEAEKIVKAPL